MWICGCEGCGTGQKLCFVTTRYSLVQTEINVQRYISAARHNKAIKVSYLEDNFFLLKILLRVSQVIWISAFDKRYSNLQRHTDTLIYIKFGKKKHWLLRPGYNYFNHVIMSYMPSALLFCFNDVISVAPVFYWISTSLSAPQTYRRVLLPRGFGLWKAKRKRVLISKQQIETLRQVLAASKTAITENV
jgi:hypothetical protein